MLMPLLLAALLGSLAPDDAREAVAKLVSPRSAERDAAERAIEAMGDLALPALAEASDSPNLELRHRAAAITDALDGRRLARPTMVKLDYASRPPSEVASGIGREAGVTILIANDAPPRPREGLITLRADAPVTLWEAIERLSKASTLRLDPPLPPGFPQRAMLNNPGRRRRGPTMHDWILRPDDGSPAAPTSDSGAFRVSIVSLILNRNRSFVRTPDPGGTPPSSSYFQVGLSVRAEPRLAIASLEPPVVTEARDDQGRSLLPSAAPPSSGPPLARVPFGEAPGSMPVSISLALPDEPGLAIASLKGTVRALVVGRRNESVAIPLGAAAGKTFSIGSDSLTIHAVRPAPDGRDITLEFTLDNAGGNAALQPMMNPQDPRGGLRAPPMAKGQIEFYDARGRLCQRVDLGSMAMSFGRQTITVQPAEGTGPPTEARYFGAAWAAIDIPFQFRDVPMP